MKAKWLLAGVSAVGIVSWALLFFRTPSISPPALLFKGYGSSGTDASPIAKLELRNTTGRAIWLCYSGEGFPQSPPFLERPILVSPKPTNVLETNIYSIRVGHFFMHGEKVLPGNSALLEFPLRSGEPAKQVGLYYYFGTFSGGNDFLSSLITPILDNGANLKEKAAFYWQMFRRRLKTPQRREVWCPDALSSHAGTTNSPVKSAN